MQKGKEWAYVLVAFICAAILTFGALGGFAEDVNVITITDYDVLDIEIGGEELEEIQFEYNGQVLAMYWDTCPVGPLWARIWAGVEAIDAGEILPMRLNQPTLELR